MPFFGIIFVFFRPWPNTAKISVLIVDIDNDAIGVYANDGLFKDFKFSERGRVDEVADVDGRFERFT